MFEIVFPLFQSALLTGISGPCEMLQAAESLRRTQHGRHPAGDKLRLVRAAASYQPVTLTGGIQVMPDALFSHWDGQPRGPAWIILPPVWGNPLPAVKREQAMIQWLQHAYRQGTLLIATGTSVCFLAQAGLLENTPVTTHWYFFDRFRQIYPDLELNTHQFITYGNNIYCAGSINALSDLILYLIEQRYGEAITRIVERHFSHELKRHYEKPFFVKGGNQHHDEDIIRAQEWCHQHWQTRFTVADWAHSAAMAERTFSRRFRQATGLSPLQYLQQLRIQQAMELLKDTNLPVNQIAGLCGFDDANYFNRLFSKRNAMTPGQYREMVRAKIFALN